MLQLVSEQVEDTIIDRQDAEGTETRPDLTDKWYQSEQNHHGNDERNHERPTYCAPSQTLRHVYRHLFPDTVCLSISTGNDSAIGTLAATSTTKGTGVASRTCRILYEMHSHGIALYFGHDSCVRNVVCWHKKLIVFALQIYVFFSIFPNF